LDIALKRSELDEFYERFLEVADKKKDISEEDLEALAGSEKQKGKLPIELVSLQVVCGKSTIPTATVAVSFNGDVFTETASGNGPIDASFTAVKNLVKSVASDWKNSSFRLSHVAAMTLARSMFRLSIKEASITASPHTQIL
jgi:hypothetical protein